MRFMFESARLGESISGFQHSLDIEGIRQCARDMEIVCAPYDIVHTPARVLPPPEIGYNHMHTTEYEEYHRIERDEVMPFSVPFNVSGQPACALPLHQGKDGLPVGVQLVGHWGDDALVLRLARQLEEAAPWIDRTPPICAWARTLGVAFVWREFSGPPCGSRRAKHLALASLRRAANNGRRFDSAPLTPRLSGADWH
jgi:hypothetical protein